MRVPIEWLSEYVELNLGVQELADKLALTGTEVERIERHGLSETDGFVVGKVLSREKHPDADRLSVCQVDVGEKVQIVCGAPNVDAGQTVGVARPGAVMPDGTKLKRAKLRGQESNGMILSERELEISQDHDGIMVLPDHLEPGTSLAEVLALSTDVLVLEITPNRPDCLGIYGVAREVAAATGAALKPPPWSEDPGSSGPLQGVEIVNQAGAELNPRFTARVFDGVQIGPSPLWLKARLMAAGQRPISNVVDITNYVMLVTGQPTHAFDLDRVAGAQLTVRRAGAGEQMVTLDGQERTLDPDVVLIDDAEGPTSIAGVMGGARSEVSAETTRVLFEAATWSGPNIHQTSWKLALHSEASTRFAKGLQPEQTLWAQALATQLLAQNAGATVRPGTIDIGAEPPAPVTLPLRAARIKKLIGTPVAEHRSVNILTALGFDVARTGEGLAVTVPAFRRADVTREVDLIEEVARLEVLQDLPATLPARHEAVGGLTERQRLVRRAADLLSAQGLHEVTGWSFAGPEQNQKLGLEHDAVQLRNPMSADQSQLRTTLLGSVLDIASHNVARGAETVRIFELGAVYKPEAVGSGKAEDTHLLALLTGAARPATWRDNQPPVADFYTAKGVVTALLDGLGVDYSLEAGRANGALHPGRSAILTAKSQRVGFVGELHPSVAAEWDIDQTVAVLAVNLDKLALPEVRRYRDLTSFPEVREDIAVLLDQSVTAAELVTTIRSAAGALLRDATVFDVYRDAERLGEGKQSLAVRLSFAAPDRTLTDEEVASKRAKIIDAVGKWHGGEIRG
ncbi:MAG: phenylalanine--tRNA ligase subunit beta [Solirubrobacterales bacterium]|nr:phenylalanine--tRNA ligase subunit beta [Solirubrobacterales bacterium]